MKYLPWQYAFAKMVEIITATTPFTEQDVLIEKFESQSAKIFKRGYEAKEIKYEAWQYAYAQHLDWYIERIDWTTLLASTFKAGFEAGHNQAIYEGV
jgi:hypothetical protein